jgi:hypothetical protein
MNWVRDCNERLVNINNWDAIDFTTINDLHTNETVAYKIYLFRGIEELVLGFVDADQGVGERIIEHVVKGVDVSLDSLSFILFRYLNNELDERFGDLPLEKTMDARWEEIKKLIGIRFVED